MARHYGLALSADLNLRTRVSPGALRQVRRASLVGLMLD